MKPILDMNAFDPEHLEDLDPALKERALKRYQSFGRGAVLFFHEPLIIERGEGCWLYAEDGTRYLDAYNNVACVGHGRPEVAEAVSAQLRRVNTHTRYLNAAVDNYAQRLLRTFPESLSNLTMTCTGSESNDLALREAFAFTGRHGVVVTKAAYHGNSYLTTAVSPSSFKQGRPPEWVEVIDAPGADGAAPEQAGQNFAAALSEAVWKLERRGIKLAALLCDTIFSSDGVYADPAGMLAPAAESLKRRGALFIADEVQPGFGRSGQMWNFARHGIVPDIVTMGKPMGNGYPMAGCVTRPEILDKLCESTGYFNTFGGTPAACAAGNAVLDILEREKLPEKAVQSGDELRRLISALKPHHPVIAAVRGAGLFTGVELRSPADGSPDGRAASLIINQLRVHQVLIGAAGEQGNVLKIRPPLTFSGAEAKLLADALEASLNELGY